MKLREKYQRRKKKKKAFEEERESGEPWCELVSMPFLDFDPSPSSLTNLNPRCNNEENHKEEDMEA